MKKLLVIAILISAATGCTTVKQAQTDFRNFQRTINFNAGQPVVYKNSYF